MKTTISLQPTLKAEIANAVSNWLRSNNRIFSSIMEEKVTNQSALLVTHAMLSLFFLIVFGPFNWMAAIMLVSWLSFAVRLLRNGGRKGGCTNV